MKLSILIPTLHHRATIFAELYAHLAKQMSSETEVVVLADEKQVSVGRKRQKLLEAANGDYIVFIDDDDWVPDNYVEKILEAVKSSPDCVGLIVECHLDEGYRKAATSMRYKTWQDGVPGPYYYLRSINHVTPVRREHALAAGFLDVRYCEDREYSARVMPLLKTEVFIDEVMYTYRFKYEDIKTKFGMTNG